jgi:hypothetical protein
LLLAKNIGTNGIFGEFAFRIGVRGDPSQIARYVEVVETLTDISISSPLNALIDRLDKRCFDVDEGKGPPLPFDRAQDQVETESPPASTTEGEAGQFDAAEMTAQEEHAPRDRRRRATAGA